MEVVPYRMLRNNPANLRKKLAAEGQLLITVDGQPFAAMIDLSTQQDIEEILIMLSRLKAQMATRAIRSQTRREQLDGLSGSDIDDLIQQSRMERQGE